MTASADVIALDDARAYLLSKKQGQAPELVFYSQSQLPEFRFYVTPKGKQLAAALGRG